MHQTDKKVKGGEFTRFGILPSTISLKIREPGSAITHFIGLIMMSIASGPLMMKTMEDHDRIGIWGMLVFVISTCILYAASTTYHTVVLSKEATTIFRKFDHVSISIMIAGTYTPICLIPLRSGLGYALLTAVWTLAIGGVIIKIFWITCPKWLSSTLYLIMGWVCIFALKPLYHTVGLGAFLWLFFGGIAYSVGAVIYAMHPKAFDMKHIYFGSHEIFHVFIMLGTFCHYMVMWLYVA